MPAAAARPAASSSAATRTQVWGRGRRAARQAPGHAPDGAARQGGLPPLCRGGERDRRASSISASCSTGRASGSWSWPRRPAAWRSRRSAPTRPETLIRISVDPAVGMQPFQAREIAFGLGLEAEPGGQGGGDHARLLPRLPRARRDDGGDQPAGDSPPTAAAGARRQDELRRQRALPPPAHRRAARQVAGGPARDPRRPTAASAMSGSTATSAASSTAPASPWRPWT